MRDACLIQFASGPKFMEQLQLTQAHHAKKCYDYGYDYILCSHKTNKHPVWGKVDTIQKAVELGYRQIFWLDTDAIWISDIPLSSAFVNNAVFNVTYHTHHPAHFNLGVMYIQNTPCLSSFLKLWQSTDDQGHYWYEQYVFNQLRDHTLIHTLSHKWNAVNWIPEYSDPDPIVIAWHGHPNSTQEMRTYCDRNRLLA
jgi:hypothetical protein